MKFEDIKLGMSLLNIHTNLIEIIDTVYSNDKSLHTSSGWYWLDTHVDECRHATKHFKLADGVELSSKAGEEDNYTFTISIPKSKVPEWARYVGLDSSGVFAYKGDVKRVDGELISDHYYEAVSLWSELAQWIQIKQPTTTLEQMADKFKAGEISLEEFTAFVKAQEN